MAVKNREEKRRELAESLIAGRKAERDGGYELSRGISSYNKWLGVTIQTEARKLAKKHKTPIVALDAGGGIGFAMADLKSRMRSKLKTAYVTSLTQHFPLIGVTDIATRKTTYSPMPRPYPAEIAPTMLVAHTEKIRLPSSSVHLITSVRGATWYTPRTVHRSIKELARLLVPGGKAFLHLTEPNKDMEAKLKQIFKGENIRAHYLYGVVAAKRGEGTNVENIRHVVETQAERDRLAEELQRGKYDYVTKYRSLRLEKRNP
ncbi:MAG: hypothetical protein V1722_00250 [Candidatus Micrarchaeota archaeon]